MNWRRGADWGMQLVNVIVVVGCFLALLGAQYTATSVVQVTELSQSQASTTLTVTTTVLQQSTSTSSTCTPGHCSFTEVLPLTIHLSASLGGAVYHTTTALNPAALSLYEWLVDIGYYLAIFGLVFSVANFAVWLYRRR
jgi:ABC-type transport system substrate-binding protein